jgi:hypothetical protein
VKADGARSITVEQPRPDSPSESRQSFSGKGPKATASFALTKGLPESPKASLLLLGLTMIPGVPEAQDPVRLSREDDEAEGRKDRAAEAYSASDDDAEVR